MKNGITELVFILDRSGSMAGLEDDTIGGFNAMIEKQKKLDGKVATLLLALRISSLLVLKCTVYLVNNILWPVIC